MYHMTAKIKDDACKKSKNSVVFFVQNLLLPVINFTFNRCIICVTNYLVANTVTM